MAKGGKHPGIPVVEWVAAAIGALIALTLFGFLIVEAMTARGDMPPLLGVVPTGMWKDERGYVVEVQVENHSRMTGAGVQIEGTLKDGVTEVETSAVTLSYVPGDSRRGAGLIFREDPRRHKLDLRVTGYEKP